MTADGEPADGKPADEDDAAGGDAVNASPTPPLLSVAGLRTVFETDREAIRAVDGVSFDLRSGETLGVVGESGSGKTATARSIMGLIDAPGRIEGAVRFRDRATVERLADRFPGRTADVSDTAGGDVGGDSNDGNEPPEAGSAVGDDDFVVVEARGPNGAIERGYVDVVRAPPPATRLVRGGGIAMVFQDSTSSLNPVYTVGNQIREALRLHRGLGGREATRKAIDLLEAVGVSDAPRRIEEYPHQLSGGMRQRAVIAVALACDPEVLICDEPTTALDVTIQAQLLELLDSLRAERDLAILFITHDMGVIAEIADRVAVMYAGEIVETAPVEELYANPRHPHTVGLLESIPGRHERGERLRTIEGDVPTPTEPAAHCRFAPRCPEAFDACDAVHPESVPVGDDATHTAACLLYPEGRSRETAVTYHRNLHERPATDTDESGSTATDNEGSTATTGDGGETDA